MYFLGVSFHTFNDSLGDSLYESLEVLFRMMLKKFLQEPSYNHIEFSFTDSSSWSETRYKGSLNILPEVDPLIIIIDVESLNIFLSTHLPYFLFQTFHWMKLLHRLHWFNKLFSFIKFIRYQTMTILRIFYPPRLFYQMKLPRLTFLLLQKNFFDEVSNDFSRFLELIRSSFNISNNSLSFLMISSLLDFSWKS